MKLSFESQILNLDIEKFEENIEYTLDDILLSENYTDNSNSHGQYQLIIEKEVHKTSKLNENAESIINLAEFINKYITYIIGFPLTKNTNDIEGSKSYIQFFDRIDGWKSNYHEVSRALQKIENPEQEAFLEVKYGGVKHMASIKNNPLHELIFMYRNRNILDDMTKLLVRFHTLALSNEFDVKYLLLGKCLEIAKVLLPVPDKPSKSYKYLPVEIQEEFKDKDISWLYKMSNYRFETRHIINDKSSNWLHIEMNNEEYYDFRRLSSLLIHYIVRKKFNLKPIISKLK